MLHSFKIIKIPLSYYNSFKFKTQTSIILLKWYKCTILLILHIWKTDIRNWSWGDPKE